MADSWDEILDPSDFKEYVANWTDIMAANSDTISTAAVILPAQATEAGLIVDVATRPVTSTDTQVVVWFRVDPTRQQDPRFMKGGTTYPVDIRVTTAQGRVLERSVNLTVAQK